MLSLIKTRSTRALSMLLMFIVWCVAVGGCVACFAKQPQKQESACCRHNKNCDQKPESGERCLTQSVDFGSTEGVRSNVPVHLAAIQIAEPVTAAVAVSPSVPVAPLVEPSPHISPHDRLSLLASFLI